MFTDQSTAPSCSQRKIIYLVCMCFMTSLQHLGMNVDASRVASLAICFFVFLLVGALIMIIIMWLFLFPTYARINSSSPILQYSSPFLKNKTELA